MRWFLPVVLALLVTGSVILAWPSGDARGAPGVSLTGEAPAAADAPPPSPGTDPDPPVAPDDALARLRAEIGLAAPVPRPSDEERLEQARAWVAANRPADGHYNALEGKMLALMDTIFEGEDRSALWTLNIARVEMEMIRALDADGDGVISDDEVAAFAAEGPSMFNPLEHPYLRAKFDADGDGELSAEELAELRRVGKMEGAFAGVLERARLDLWDNDGDGLLSDEERAAGERAALARIKYFADGHIERVEDPGEISREEQARVLASLEETFGADFLKALESQREIFITQAVSQSLMEAMRVENTDPHDLQAAMMESMPAGPDQASFDADGDGALGPEEQRAQATAMEAYQREIETWAAQQSASMLRIQFEHAASEHDLDGDGRMSDEEWDARLADLLDARARRLFLREYDLDSSGRVETGELDTFVRWYRAGSLRADANFDGRVDAADLQQVLIDYQAQGL